MESYSKYSIVQLASRECLFVQEKSIFFFRSIEECVDIAQRQRRIQDFDSTIRLDCNFIVTMLTLFISLHDFAIFSCFVGNH